MIDIRAWIHNSFGVIKWIKYPICYAFGWIRNVCPFDHVVLDRTGEVRLDVRIRRWVLDTEHTTRTIVILILPSITCIIILLISRKISRVSWAHEWQGLMVDTVRAEIVGWNLAFVDGESNDGRRYGLADVVVRKINVPVAHC